VDKFNRQLASQITPPASREAGGCESHLHCLEHYIISLARCGIHEPVSQTQLGSLQRFPCLIQVHERQRTSAHGQGQTGYSAILRSRRVFPHQACKRAKPCWKNWQVECLVSSAECTYERRAQRPACHFSDRSFHREVEVGIYLDMQGATWSFHSYRAFNKSQPDGSARGGACR
jgi:hypothetical protein